LATLADLGFVITIVGLLVTMVFGFTASTRSSLQEFRRDAVGRLDEIAEGILTIRSIIDDRLPPSISR
jgi:hypothetical protein